MYQGKYIPIGKFNGGYSGNFPSTQLSLNQANDLDNIVIKDGGLGFRSRRGNGKLQATTLNSGANIQGLFHFLLSSGTDYWVAVAGSKIYNVNPSGSPVDITGAVTVTSGADNHWSFATFNDQLISFGGPLTSPNAPWKWTGSGDASALGGSPPSAYGCFAANNRMFAFRTSANPSTIYWSIIGSAEDWTGTGSGSTVVGNLNDNQAITASAILSTNYILMFKESATYQMVLSTAPFPVYTLYDTVGCVGKDAVVVVDGEAYWVTKYQRMVSSQGDEITEYPSSADDLWDSVQSTRLPYIKGFRQNGTDYDWIVWLVSTTGSTNNMAIIWDRKNKCWLRNTTGYKFNVSHTDYNLVSYGGAYDGFIYQLDKTSTFADASETAPGTITAYWRSGWLNITNDDEVMQVRRLVAQFLTKASGDITTTYGFDFVPDSASFTLSQIPTASEVVTSKRQEITHRGNFFQFKIGSSSAAIDTQINNIILGGKAYGQKRLSAS